MGAGSSCPCGFSSSLLLLLLLLCTIFFYFLIRIFTPCSQGEKEKGMKRKRDFKVHYLIPLDVCKPFSKEEEREKVKESKRKQKKAKEIKIHVINIPWYQFSLNSFVRVC